MLSATRAMAVVVIAATGGTVHADPTPEDRAAAQERFRFGAQAFRANRFAVAVLAFEQAYVLDPRPETAFSIAQANRLQYYLDKNAWRLQRALQLYEVYLAALPAGKRAQDAITGIGEVGPLVAELRQRGELVPYAPQAKTQLVIGAEVDVATVRIDGRPATLWEPLDVAAGAHSIEVEAAGFETARRKVTVPAGQFLPIDIALVPKPGRLALRTDSDVTVYVDGQRRGTTTDEGRIALPLAPGKHFVSATRRGRDSWSRTITIDRDQTTAVDVDLVPTAQRRVARWVLGAAAGLGTGTLAMGLWSYAARREAQQLDEDRLGLMATPEDLVRYNELVSDAESRGDIALGLGIGAAAIGLVGLGMLWFDQPPPDANDSIDLAPVVTDTDVGFAVRGHF